MVRQLESNKGAKGEALGYARALELAKREKVPSSLHGKDMPKSVEEAVQLVRSTFGEAMNR